MRSCIGTTMPSHGRRKQHSINDRFYPGTGFSSGWYSVAAITNQSETCCLPTYPTCQPNTMPVLHCIQTSNQEEELRRQQKDNLTLSPKRNSTISDALGSTTSLAWWKNKEDGTPQCN
ncbi:hypothetical protein O181_099245 [Austropuccinia psidii MF-1]|uniref:Uncharacterized protein n=1 Tax=Austropuccinia psidii MF-1 TaxID=1389203 RepID=A0A9Q3JAP1_9BASI|nr:hypothetical protein [Austropuccinia psidii MF-1]